jgi:NAD(P)H-quinone oxidoreductase subunit 6
MVFLPETINSPILYLLDIGIILGGFGVSFFWKNYLFSPFSWTCFCLCSFALSFIKCREFLAASQVLIYVGAINVLIVFAIMLVNKPEKETNRKKK